MRMNSWPRYVYHVSVLLLLPHLIPFLLLLHLILTHNAHNSATTFIFMCNNHKQNTTIFFIFSSSFSIYSFSYYNKKAQAKNKNLCRLFPILQ